MSGYIPDRGHIVWLDFNPQAGHEQAGRRPALVISPSLYNGRTDLCIACPITSSIKGYPFEVPLPKACKVRGVVLADQIKNLDWKVRRAEPIDQVSDELMAEITDKIIPLVTDVS